jgi:hypothetical protein
MFAGHFGLAAAVKSKQPRVPLWALMLSTQLLDVIFVPLVLLHVESLQPIGQGGYGEAIIHAWYSHSLVGALLIAGAAGLLAARFWGRQGGLTIAAVVFSHWVLDLLVHRADLPILPGNLGNLPLLGLGLWTMPAISAGLEGLLIIIGAVLYTRSVISRHPDAFAKSTSYRVHALTAAIVLSVLLPLSLLTDLLGL